MPEPRPLLTIAVPTYSRAANLRILLEALLPQVNALPQVELLISDNCSPDETPAVVQEFQQAGLRCRYHRHQENIGPDANFLSCYEKAAGKYVWIFGDDDVLFPGSLDRLVHLIAAKEYDVVFLAPSGFLHDSRERGQPNTRAAAREFTQPEAFLHAVGLMGDFALISSVLVNKDTVEREAHPSFREALATNLVQLGWTFTALRRLRRGLVIERGMYAVCELNPSRPFDVIRIFGEHWHQVADTFLQRGSRLWNAVLNDQLYSWFVTNWYGMRRQGFAGNTPDPTGQMRRYYGRRPAFWVLTWPLLRWPMLPAGAWLAALRAIRRIDLWRLRRTPPLEA